MGEAGDRAFVYRDEQGMWRFRLLNAEGRSKATSRAFSARWKAERAARRTNPTVTVVYSEARP